MFDIVILVGPNDAAKIHTQLQYTRKHVIGFRNIYIVSYDPLLKIEDCIMIYENIFPFTKQFVVDYFANYHGKHNRNSWYYQQLLKLYVGSLVPDMLDRYLVIDADVYFYKPLEFEIGGKMVFNLTDTYHRPYFTHMQNLHPSFQKHIKQSAISHHMMFCKPFIRELFEMVENHHKKPFWKAFIECVTEHMHYPPEAIESGASEYEIYMNFMAYYHADKITFRKLKWEDKPHDYYIQQSTDLDYVSVCHWM